MPTKRKTVKRKKSTARKTRAAGPLTKAETALFKEMKNIGRGRHIKPETLKRLREKAAKLARERKGQRLKDVKISRDLRGVEKTLAAIEKGIRSERRAVAGARRGIRARVSGKR